jgi:hypothetical protein
MQLIHILSLNCFLNKLVPINCKVLRRVNLGIPNFSDNNKSTVSLNSLNFFVSPSNNDLSHPNNVERMSLVADAKLNLIYTQNFYKFTYIKVIYPNYIIINVFLNIFIMYFWYNIILIILNFIVIKISNETNFCVKVIMYKKL